MSQERLAGRIDQLSRGVRGAAAALPEERADLASRATEEADRMRAAARGVVAGLREDGGDAAGGPRLVPGTSEADVERTLEEALRALEDLHYAILRVAVLDEEADPVGVEEEVEVTRDVAGALRGLLEGGTPGSDPAADPPES